MAEATNVKVGGESPEQVAHRLLVQIATLEGKWSGYNFQDVDRKWVLDTYAECLTATKGNR